MLESFDVVIDGFIYHVHSFVRHDLPVRVFRVQVYLSSPDEPVILVDNIGGDVSVDVAFLSSEEGKQHAYGKMFMCVLRCHEYRKANKSDLVQMVK
jgi:hypothetical protein